MGLLNLDQRRMLSGAQFHYNVKSRHAFDQFTGTKSVSYTHLDVYKRQGTELRELANRLETLFRIFF